MQGFFLEIYKLILRLIWEMQRTKIAKTIFKKNKIGGRLIQSNFKTYYTATMVMDPQLIFD